MKTALVRVIAACSLAAAIVSPAVAAGPIVFGLVDEVTGPQAEDFPTDSTGPSFEKNLSYPERWKPWREFTIFYHDDSVNVQAFGNVSPGNLEVNEQYPEGTDSDNFAINYGIAGIVPIIFAFG